MDVSRIFLKTANSLLSAVIVLFLVVAGAYSAYALWDNMQVYASVDDIQSQLLKYKPTPGEGRGFLRPAPSRRFRGKVRQERRE